MSFGLKNVSATYQRDIQVCFKRQLNKNVEAYVDDVVVKTRSSSVFSHPYGSAGGSSTRTSVFSAYLRENYSASSSAIVASKPIPRRSQPLPR
jgi:hypothetical protein